MIEFLQIAKIRFFYDGRNLFSHAEAGEDSAKYFVGRDLSGDSAKIMQGIAEVYGQKVGREVAVQSMGHLVKRGGHLTKCLVMTEVGEHHTVGIGHTLPDGLDNTLLKVVDTEACTG